MSSLFFESDYCLLVHHPSSIFRVRFALKLDRERNVHGFKLNWASRCMTARRRPNFVGEKNDLYDKITLYMSFSESLCIQTSRTYTDSAQLQKTQAESGPRTWAKVTWLIELTDRYYSSLSSG